MKNIIFRTVREYAAAMLVLGPLLGAISPANCQVNYAAGKSYFGRSNYVEYLAGDMPIIISAPHGGTLKPAEIPDRTEGTFDHDSKTEELARAIQRQFHGYFGHYPHVIICRLWRRKVDCNRNIDVGAQNNPAGRQAWHDFQNFIEAARSQVLAQSQRGFYIDLHGQGHPIKRVELGYHLTTEQLAQPDAVLNEPRFARRSTIYTLASRVSLPFSELLRGSNSFGGMLAAKGYPCVPSPEMPDPGSGNIYFYSGYNVENHGSIKGGTIDGLQLECNYPGLRDTAADREKFARALAEIMAAFFARYYALDLKTGGQPAR